MILKSGSFAEMAENIKKENKEIIIFGAGVIGTIIMPEILHSFGLSDFVGGYIDNDKSRWGEKIRTRYSNNVVYSPDILRDKWKNTVVLLTISRYADVINQLKEMECTAEMVCYIVPMMLIYGFQGEKDGSVIKEYQKQIIPKRINYIWLGKKEIPYRLRKCMESWEKYCPDYEIVQWNEDKYNFKKNTYMKQAYEAGAYGFVPDFARLDILYTYGGLYMDTDVEVIRSLDELLYQDAFCGVEKWQTVNFGGCSGAVQNNKMIREFMENRERLTFLKKDGSYNKLTCGFYDTQVILKHGYRISGKSQKVKEINIYASEFFHPYDYTSGITTITANTYCIHHFNGGWMDKRMKNANLQTQKEFATLYKSTLKGVSNEE